jgi:chromosome segregation ATPase
VAAKAANLWVEAVKRRVNAIPLARLEASLKALEEQVTPAEKAYREAQARWEAFNKTTTLPQDKAELDAKTQERVGLDTELAGLERDLAAVQGRIQATLAEMRRQEAIVPIGTPPEQLAIINRRLAEAQASLARELERVRQSYTQAAQVLEKFKGREQIPVWQAELSAYTEAYASAQARLIALQKDLAQKQALLQDAEARLAEYKAQLPNLSIENLVAGLTVKEAEALVADRLKEADSRLKAAEGAWAEFQRKSQLEVWKRQLGGYADRVASIRQRLESLATDRFRVEADLGEARRRFDQYKAQLPNLSIENLVAGLTVKEAEALVADRLKEADSRLKAAEGAWAEFQRKSQLEVWKRQLGGYADRVASIRQRLESLATERAIKQTRLEEAEKELAKEPRLITLEREITADPAVAAAIAQGGNLRDLLGLKLKNQELNPTHLKLLSTALDLRADLAALDREEKALKAEEAKLAPLVQDLQRRIADEEALRARLLTELDTARDIYNAVYRYAESLKKVASRPDVVLREVSPDVLAYRDRIVDLEARLVALKAEEEALKEEEAKLAPLVQDLQRRIADEEATRARLLTELDTARDIYNAVYRYAESLKKVASRPDVVLREVSPDVAGLPGTGEACALGAGPAAADCGRGGHAGAAFDGVGHGAGHLQRGVPVRGEPEEGGLEAGRGPAGGEPGRAGLPGPDCGLGGQVGGPEGGGGGAQGGGEEACALGAGPAAADCGRGGHAGAAFDGVGHGAGHLQRGVPVRGEPEEGGLEAGRGPAGGEPGRAGLPGPGGGPQGRDRGPEGGGGSPQAEPHRAGRAHPRPQGQDRRPGAGEGGRDPGVRHQEGGLRGLP